MNELDSKDEVDLSDIEDTIGIIEESKRKLERVIPGREQPLLFGAAQRGKANILKNLIHRGVDVNSLDSRQNLAVDYAWRKQFYDVVLLLLEADSCFPKGFNGVNVDNLKKFVEERNLLHKYIQDDDLENVRKMVAKSKSRYYLNQMNESATFTALKCKKFNIHIYLNSIGAEFLNDDERKELENLEIKDKFALREASVIHFPSVNSEPYIDYLLSKSRSPKPVEGCRDLLKSYYLKLDEIPEVSAILKVIQHSDYLDVVFDFDEEDVKAVNPFSSKNTRGETMYKEGRLYIAAGPQRGERKIMGTMAHELTHMAMELLFENECNPYVRNGEKCFEEITRRTLSTVGKVDEGAGKILWNVRNGYRKEDYDCELIVTVPQILAEHEQGREWLQENAFELLHFYTEVIIPKCEDFSNQSPTIKPKNKIRKFNESLGEITKLRKLKLNFENVDSVNDFMAKKDAKIFVLKTEHTHLGMIKILQAMFGCDYTSQTDKYLALTFDNLIFELREVMHAYLEGCETLILQFNQEPSREMSRKCFGMLSEILDIKPGKKVVFVIHPNMDEGLCQTLREHKLSDVCAHKTDDFVCLDEKSKGTILSKEIMFHGMKMILKDLIGNGNFAEFIKEGVIEDIIQGKDVHVGSRTNDHPNLEKAFGYVYEKIDVESFVRELKESRDTFVIYGLREKDAFLSHFNEDWIVNQIQIINSEYFKITNKRILLTDRFSDGDVKKFCLHNRDKKINFIEIEDNAFVLKSFYNPDFYLERKFKIYVTDLAKLQDLISAHMKPKFPREFFIISGFELEEKYDNVLLLNIKDAEEFFNYFNENEEICKARIFRIQDEEVNLHWFHIQNPEEVHWINSLGSIKNLRDRFKHLNISNEFSVTERDLIRNLAYKKTVLIADNPGMGKSTTLSKLYESPTISGNHWVIRIDLKEHVNEIKAIDTKNFNIQDLVSFLLKIKPNFDNKLTEDLLKSILTTDIGFARCLLAFDGFDEILDEQYRAKVIFLFKYAQKYTKSKIWVTTRVHHEKQLENELSTLALKFDPIGDDNKKIFIKKFLREHTKLVLNPEIVREIFEGRIWTYTEIFLKYMKNIFHKDVSTFIGTPLQLNLMTENSVEHFKNWAKNEELKDFSYLGENVLEVYEKFIDKKYEIYFKKQNIKDEFVQKREKNFSKQYHKALAEALARDKHFDSNWYEDTCLMLLIGLIQSANDAKHAQFVHFTIREYFFALVFTDHIMNPLNKPSIYDEKMDYLIGKILLQPEHHLVRNFINMQLEKHDMKEIPKHNMEMFGKMFTSFWLKKKVKGCSKTVGVKICWRSQTILRNAVDERNENIFRLIFSCCEKDMSDALYVKIMIAGDKDLFLLHKAIYNSNLRICDLLFEKIEKLPLLWRSEIMKTNGAMFQLAVKSGDPDTVRFVYKKLRNLLESEKLPLVLTEKPDGKSALYRACELGHCEVVKTLLDISDKILPPEDQKKFLAASHLENKTITGFYAAVKNGHTDVVKVLLDAERQMPVRENEKLILTSYDSSQTVLHIAAANGHSQMMEILLKGMESLSQRAKMIVLMMRDPRSQTVLHLAAKGNHTEVVKILLGVLSPEERKVLFSKRNGDSETVLHIAAKYASVELMNILLSNDIHTEATVLFTAVENGRGDIVKVLLHSGSRKSIQKRDDHSQTLLHVAAVKGFVETFEILLKEGIELLPPETKADLIMTTDANSQTILHVAVSKGHTAIAEIILQTALPMLSPDEQTKFFTMTNASSETILHLSAKHSDVKLTGLLLKKSDILSVEDQKKMLTATLPGQPWLTALYRAVENGHINTVKAFVIAENQLKEESILKRDGTSQTVLHIAAAEGHVEIIKILLNEGIKNLPVETVKDFIMATDASTQTVLHVAVGNGHIDVVQVILGTAMNMLQSQDTKKFFTMTNWASETVLHIAAKHRSVQLMCMLLKKTEDILSCSERKEFLLARNHYSETVFRLVTQHYRSVELQKILIRKSKGILTPKEMNNCLTWK